MTTEKIEPKDKDDAEIVRDLVKKIEKGYDYLSASMANARANKYFLYVDQWSQEIREERTINNRPCMTYNRLVPLMRSILGQQREQTPSIDVRDMTVDLKIPQATVDMVNDFIRELSYTNNLDIHLQTVFSQFLEAGWGASRVYTAYEKDSFDQKIIIEPVADIESVVWDPAAQKFDKSDGDYCGIYEVVSKKRFEGEYPDIDMPVSAPGGTQTLSWVESDAIIVCEIYVKEYFNKIIYQLSDGTTGSKEEVNAKMEEHQQMLEQLKSPEFSQQNPEMSQMLEMAELEPLEIVNKRNYKDYKIKYYKFIQGPYFSRFRMAGQDITDYLW